MLHACNVASRRCHVRRVPSVSEEQESAWLISTADLVQLYCAVTASAILSLLSSVPEPREHLRPLSVVSLFIYLFTAVQHCLSLCSHRTRSSRAEHAVVDPRSTLRVGGPVLNLYTHDSVRFLSVLNCLVHLESLHFYVSSRA